LYIALVVLLVLYIGKLPSPPSFLFVYLLDLEVGLIKCCGANASQSFIVKITATETSGAKLTWEYVINDRPVGNPKRRFDEYSSKFSLSYETKV
jgi:hypothetical protein